MRPVCLLTDFGTRDWYTGVLHAVLERDAPGVHRIDLGHDVPAGDVAAGIFHLQRCWPWLPENAVILAVVDPGVGTDRRAVAARYEDRWLVAPDNGLATAGGVPDAAREIFVAGLGLPKPSSTFHGRDVFAPAAARLARGDEPQEMGPAVAPERLVVSTFVNEAPRVVHIDGFGNVISNVRADQVAPGALLAWEGGMAAVRVNAYGVAAPGTLVTIQGSSGFLEIANVGGSAAARTGLSLGDPVVVVEEVTG